MSQIDRPEGHFIQFASDFLGVGFSSRPVIGPLRLLLKYRFGTFFGTYMGKQSDDESMGKDSDSDDESEWRFASIVGFNAQTGDHRLLYADGTREWLPLILHETKAASDSNDV